MTTLAAVVDALVPAAAGLPGAAQSDVADRLPATLAAAPALAAPARRALAALTAPHGQLEEALAGLERDDPEGFAALVELVAVTWATGADVRAALGHDPDAPLDLAGLTRGEELLGPVVARGPRWKGSLS